MDFDQIKKLILWARANRIVLYKVSCDGISLELSDMQLLAPEVGGRDNTPKANPVSEMERIAQQYGVEPPPGAREQ